MKKLFSIVMAILFLISWGCTRTPLVSEEDFLMHSELLEQVVFFNRWFFENSEELFDSPWAFNNLMLDLDNLRHGREPNTDPLFRNSHIYNSLHLIRCEEETHETSLDTTLIVWPSNDTKKMIDWFNLMARVPYRNLTQSQIENGQDNQGFYVLFAEHNLSWPLSLDNIINNTNDVMALWSRLNSVEQNFINNNVTRSVSIPTIEEFLEQLEAGVWKW